MFFPTYESFLSNHANCPISLQTNFRLSLRPILLGAFNSKTSIFSHFKRKENQCAKFSGSRAIVDFVGLVPSCHRVIVDNSCVPNFFSWVFRRSKIFFSGYFVGLKSFFVGISWASNLLSWVFRGSKIFSRGYTVGAKFSLVGNFVIFSCWPHEKKWRRNTSQTTYSIPN